MKDDAPNVIIPTEHQSAPKEHWMNGELRKAAEEIDAGRFLPKLADDDFFYIGPEQLLWQHPRIADALEKLKGEVEASSNSQEFIERSQMLHEMNERAAAPDKWDGQGRWMGKENEEERQGELLTPHEFMRRLTAVIGNRLELFRYAVQGRLAVLMDDPDPSPIILPQYQQPGLKGKKQVATLQYPIGTEWMVMKFDNYGVPLYAKFIGWRTALLSLISLGIITEKQAHTAFPVEGNHASLWYRAQLYQMRNGGTA